MVGIYIILFLLGAAVGSFINVIALRYGSGLPFTHGSSICLSCGKPLSWRELIPIISYIALRGRCSRCQSRFSTQYFLVELISGIAFVWLFLLSNLSFFQSFLLSIIYCLLSIIFLYDLRHKIIPDVFVVLFALFSFLYSFYILHFTLYDILLPAILIPLPFVLIWLFSRGRLMGLGDAKFMVGMGFLLGIQKGISAVFLSFWLGAALILILFLYKKIFRTRYNSYMDIGMKSEIPFAPFLVLGTVLTFLFNINLLDIDVSSF